MASLLNRFKDSVSNNSYQPKLGSLRDQVGDFVASVQEDLGVLDELRYEWRRLQTFVDWPLDLPRPSELAKAGFFFTPTEDTPDRCAHFCTDKFFSAWEAADDPWEVLRDNCPDCPFVLGASNNVPLPSAYVPHAGEEGGKEATRRAHSDLGSYLTQAVQRVAAAAGSSVQASSVAAAGGGGAGAGGFGELRTEGALKVTSKAKKKGKRGGKSGAKGGGSVEDDVYGKVFNAGGGGADDFPSALVGGEDSESGETPRGMTMSREEWERLAERISSAVKTMQGQWEEKIGVTDARLSTMKTQVEGVAEKTQKLWAQDWLQAKKKEVADMGAVVEEKKAAVSAVQAELTAVTEEVQKHQEELEKLKEAEALKEEWDRKVREASEEVEELQDQKGSLEGEISELEDHKQQLLDEAEAEKERIRESMKGLKGAKKEAEADMVEVQDNIERRKKELEMFESRLKDWGRKEEALVAKQVDLEAREDELKRKEAQLKSREEWLLQKEGEQRGLERRKLTPRSGSGTPRVTREGLAPIDQALETRLVEAEEEEDMESKREELLGMMVM